MPVSPAVGAPEPTHKRPLNPAPEHSPRIANPAPSERFALLHIRRLPPGAIFQIQFLAHRRLCALPVQQPSSILVDWSGLVSQRRIRTTCATRMLTLPALSALLKFLKAKGTGRTPVSTPGTHRRNPVVLTPAMLALAADRHTSRLYQNPPSPATAVVAPRSPPRTRANGHTTPRPARRLDQPRPFPRVPQPTLQQSPNPALRPPLPSRNP
jgi:hypothetical protein